jgi:hypothetical protein
MGSAAQIMLARSRKLASVWESARLDSAAGRAQAGTWFWFSRPTTRNKAWGREVIKELERAGWLHVLTKGDPIKQTKIKEESE